MGYREAGKLRLVVLTTVLVFTACQAARAESGGTSAKDIPAKPADRAASVRALVRHLGLGEGSVIADIGAGNGRDTWVFAKIAGGTGTVLAEEISQGKVKSLEAEARKRELKQVRPVLGRSDDPCLPPNSADLAYMNHVYHHFAKPREMLRQLWRSLKPGGFLVVVDRRRGTLRDWVPRQLREKRHFWIAETTVVREAREEGFCFVRCAEDLWYSEDNFVLVFRRPKGLAEPGGDPDAFDPLPVRKCAQNLVPLRDPYQHPVFIALGEGRELIAPILRHCDGHGTDVILEEWATQKDERPPLAPGLSLPSTLTQNGDPGLGPEPVDVVFSLDSYHLLFLGQTLLARLHDRLAPAGFVYILDRGSEKRLSRRESSHHRMIQPETVEQEMAEAGFCLWFRGRPCAGDRFLLVFGKESPERLAPERDPFVGGPQIDRKPHRWLRNNCWRLRGVRSTGGKCVLFGDAGSIAPDDIICRRSSEARVCEISGEGHTLRFEQQDKGYVLVDCRKGP